jgi:hypothetical protein
VHEKKQGELKMKKLILAMIATILIAPAVMAAEKECLLNKDYFEICKRDSVYDSRRDENGESYLMGTVINVFTTDEGAKMAVVYWPIHMGEDVTETVSIDLLSNSKGPICMVNADEMKICKNDSVFDRRREMESHLNGTVLSLFIQEGVEMAVVEWPVIGGTTTRVTGSVKEEVRIDDLY